MTCCFLLPLVLFNTASSVKTRYLNFLEIFLERVLRGCQKKHFRCSQFNSQCSVFIQGLHLCLCLCRASITQLCSLLNCDLRRQSAAIKGSQDPDALTMNKPGLNRNNSNVDVYVCTQRWRLKESLPALTMLVCTTCVGGQAAGIFYLKFSML